MKVLFVTSEFADFAKSGGLADVSAALPRALRQAGVDVRVLLPGYPQVLRKARALSVIAYLPGRGEIEPCLLGEMRTEDGLALYVALSPSLYQREGTPYLAPDGTEWPDTDLRFARLALAAAEIARGLDALSWRPDVVHANDWPTGLAPAFLRWDRIDVPSVMTIHNLAYQGLFPAERRFHLAIPEGAFGLNGVEFHNQVSFMKAGLYYASEITTVSPTYAKQVTGHEHGAGLDGLLGARADEGRLHGIINGADSTWDPTQDRHLEHRFSRDDLAGKARMKEAVRTALCLNPGPGPLFSIVSRLVHQKGLDLVAEVAGDIIGHGGQVAILGIGDAKTEQMLVELVRTYRGSFALLNGFNEPMAHRIIAASDFYLMPSRFEPCGLSQMHAELYGAPPVGHATGGLCDTIEDGTSGFLFSDFSRQGFMAAIERAFQTYADPAALTAMRQTAMGKDFRWEAPARSYMTLYARMTGTEVPSSTAPAVPSEPLRQAGAA